MVREDCNDNFWKEKFIYGLPTLFVDKIHAYFCAKHGRVIPYDMYIYSEPTTEIIGQGLQLCNDLKLHHQLTTERVQNKQALGDFYQ